MQKETCSFILTCVPLPALIIFKQLAAISFYKWGCFTDFPTLFIYYFVLLFISFALRKFPSFRKFHLLIVALSICATGVIFRKLSPVPVHSRLIPTFSSIRFGVTRFMLRSLIHLGLSFGNGDKYGFLHSTCQHPVMPVPFVEVAFSFFILQL